ncbi:dihydroorotase [Jannaschia sp. Os4]|uniref:dihydroorotase n=1 Tax=Jannaschia sp. Os4 TaxID=2807617 RepID=UPI0019395093|nr:dihydroorotase [Jannaschia sp. Os4]MBM2575001.1 dihydroorotase [Jannaschia sp. Os4]
MSVLLTNAILIDPEAGTVSEGEIRIEDGRITPPGPAKEVIDCGGRHLAPGIVDLGVKVGEPGERHKESFRTAGEAARRGGVTMMVCRPDTTPPVDTPETFAFVQGRAATAGVRVRQMATLTKGRAGREMVEMGFLSDAGAVAFTDGDHVVRDAKALSRCLTYARSLGALVIGHPQEPSLSDGAAATSGKFASLRGLPAVSPVAERMGLERDLALVGMTGAKWHADQITTEGALGPLRAAKAAGLDVTAGTSIHHVTLNALDVADYRTFFKLKPPLRDEDDRIAVAEALADGTIDVLCSMHTPQDEESKRLPFEQAASGAVGLETFVPAALRLFHAGMIELPVLWRAMSTAPARRLGIEGGSLAEGAVADLVLVDVGAPFVLDRWAMASKSKNTPFDGTRLQGRVKATWVGGELVWGGV